LQKLAIIDPFNTQDNQTCSNTYDDLARISGNTCGSTWAQTFGYDAFGNISKTGSISWGCLSCYTYSTNRYNTVPNQITYDTNGNLLADSFNTYTWDVFGDLASANGNAITYDAFGRMVENSNGGNQFAYGPTGTNPLASLQGQTLLGAFVPLPGGAVALYNSGGLTQYNHADWLGSARLFSNPSRVAIPAMSYAPFGEGYAGGQGYVQFTNTGNAFTVYDTENQSGSLTDFTYRRYAPVQGRWIAPDPAGLAAVDPTNPQSWNRYAYVGNNPLSSVDPLGLDYQDCDAWTGNCLPCNNCGGAGGPGPGNYGGNVPGAPPSQSGSGSGFSFTGGPLCNSDFMPCGLPTPGLYQSIWSDLLGLPTDLDCPQTGGILGPLCGGVSPIMDATPTQCLRPPMSTIDSIPTGATTCGDFICGENGDQISIAPPEARGLSEDATVEFGIAGAASGSVDMVLNPLKWFGKGTWLNSGQYWRIGFSRLGGDSVFRLFVKGVGKLDFWNCGPL
jgi:RHS repeat-associated protein